MDEFESILLASKAPPVLFIGSGLSRRWLGTPDWEGLLDHFAQEVGREIGYYKTRFGADYPRIASEIAKSFVEIWWDDARFESSRAEYKGRVENDSHPLKIEVAKYIKKFEILDDEVVKTEIDSIRQAKIYSVITTNWDNMLPGILTDFHEIVGQSEMLTASSASLGDKFKIHGSGEDPLGIVLTEKDYDDYGLANPYLVAKMITMFVEHPIVFLGYSLRDPNIQDVLSSIVKCLSQEQLNKLKDRLIFVGRVNGKRPEGLKMVVQSTDAGAIVVHEYGVQNLVGVFQTLAALPMHYPIGLLRRMREDVYNLAYWGKPGDRIQVIPFDSNDDLDKIEMVIGMGAIEALSSVGYRRLTRKELFADMVRGKTGHAPDGLTNQLMSDILKNSTYSPLFYPLSMASKLDTHGKVVDPRVLPNNAQKLLANGVPSPPSVGKTRVYREMNFMDILSRSVKDAIYYGTVARYSATDVVGLRRFLAGRLVTETGLSTDLAKICCTYDRLVYGDGWEGDRAELLAALKDDFETAEILSGWSE